MFQRLDFGCKNNTSIKNLFKNGTGTFFMNTIHDVASLLKLINLERCFDKDLQIMKGNNCKTARKFKEYFVSVRKLFKSSNQHWQNKRIALTISPCLGSSWFLLRAGETKCSQREPTQVLRCKMFNRM